MGTVEFPRVVDRNVATPSLVKLTNVESNIYNVEPETGTVVEEGTPLDSALFTGVKNYIDSETEDAIKFASKEDSFIHLENYNHISTLGIGTQGKTSVNLLALPYRDGTIPDLHGVSFTPNNDGSIACKGTATATITYYLLFGENEKYKKLEGKTCSISCDGLQPGMKLGVFGANFANILSTSSPSKYTSTIDRPIVYIILEIEQGKTVNTTLYPMLVEGSTPQPWTPSGITSINELAYQVRGKNLNTLPVSGRSTIYIKYGTLGNGIILPAGRYVCSFSNLDFTAGQLSVRNATNNDVVKYVYSSNELSFEVVDNAPIYFEYYSPSHDLTQVHENFQLELGDTATPYEPYTATTTPVDLQGYELCSLPDGTHDEVQVTTEGTRIEKGIGKVILDGSNLGTFYTDIYKAYGYTDIKIANIVGVAITTVCDKYDSVSIYSMQAANKCVAQNTTANRILIKDTAYNSLEEWNAALAANPITVYYKLADPQTIPLPSVDLPTLPAPVANVWSETNMPEVTTKLDCIYAKNVDVYDFVNSITDEKPHIIDNGTSANWDWVKWSDGRAMCWRSKQTTLPYSGAYHGDYSSQWVSFYFPFEFIENPTYAIQANPAASFTPNYIVSQSYKNRLYSYFMSKTDYKGHEDNIWVSIIAIGRWK